MVASQYMGINTLDQKARVKMNFAPESENGGLGPVELYL